MRAGGRVYVTDVEPGDTIEWASHRVLVRRVEHGYPDNRPAVYLTIVSDHVSERRCHYFADEIVTVVR